LRLFETALNLVEAEPGVESGRNVNELGGGKENIVSLRPSRRHIKDGVLVEFVQSEWSSKKRKEPTKPPGLKRGEKKK